MAIISVTLTTYAITIGNNMNVLLALNLIHIKSSFSSMQLLVILVWIQRMKIDTRVRT